MGAIDLIFAEGDFGAEFFAPVASDLVDGLVGQYRSMRARIEQVAAMVTGETAGAMAYFLGGNSNSDRHYSTPSVERLFEPAGAISALNADYWGRALALTDVLDCMPQARRDEWNKQIREMTAPDFEEETVRATLQDLLLSRQRFFAERVDGIFRNLSGEHVTNSPMGFGKRMILAGIHNGYYETERVGYINDLRCVIAKFMGRDEPHWNASAVAVKEARSRHGEWLSIDGGALRLRVYLKGTAHLEVHPDMAWRLNCVLAQLYPMAIPAEFRQKPRKRLKEFQMIQRPLPFAVLAVLGGLEPAMQFERIDGGRDPYRRTLVKNALQFRYGAKDGAGFEEAQRVLAALGGVLTKDGHWQFDYDAGPVVAEILCSGCIPDQKAHQFYPTPERLARIAIEAAEIGPEHTCLEPSAGTGGLADFMPKERTTCVEISGLHCKVLEAKSHRVVWNDFLPWASGRAADGKRFDRIVMNPPFSDGRAQAHLYAAAELVASGGLLVAILPSSMRGKTVLPGWNTAWSEVYAGEFAGTGVSVAILTAEAPR